jgi:hypothetical protein
MEHTSTPEEEANPGVAVESPPCFDGDDAEEKTEEIHLETPAVGEQAPGGTTQGFGGHRVKSSVVLTAKLLFVLPTRDGGTTIMQ